MAPLRANSMGFLVLSMGGVVGVEKGEWTPAEAQRRMRRGRSKNGEKKFDL